MRIKNWRKYQHYKHRNPPWIKFHRSLLDDPEWFALSGDASKVLANCWLVASDFNGELPPMKDLAFRLRMKVEELERLIAELDHWLEPSASTMLAPCKHDASKGDPQSQSQSQSQSNNNYRFAGRTLRLIERDYVAWQKNYNRLDLDANLQELDDYYTVQGCSASQAFIRASAALRKRNEALKPKSRVAVGYLPEVVPPSPPLTREELAAREASVAKAEKILGRKIGKGRRDALVCGDDEGQERMSSKPTLEGAGLRNVLSASQGLDDTEEDQAERVDKAVLN